MKIQHPKWKPSSKLFYRKYHTAIKLGYFSYNSKPGIPAKYEDYRIVRRFIEVDNQFQTALIKRNSTAIIGEIHKQAVS